MFRRNYDSLSARGIAESFIKKLIEIEESSPQRCSELIALWSADQRLQKSPSLSREQNRPPATNQPTGAICAAISFKRSLADKALPFLFFMPRNGPCRKK